MAAASLSMVALRARDGSTAREGEKWEAMMTNRAAMAAALCGVYNPKEGAAVGCSAHKHVPAAVPRRVGVRAHGPPQPLAGKHAARRPGLPLAQAPPPRQRSPLRRVFQGSTLPPSCRVSPPVAHAHILHCRISLRVSPRARAQQSLHQAVA